MTDRQIALVKNSWESVKPKSAQLAEVFYYRLFEKNPQFRVLFKGSFYEQQQKFLHMMDMIIANAQQLDSVGKDLRVSGRLHEGYGVKKEDYATVGAAFLYALKSALQDEWNKEYEEAWTTAYGAITLFMLEEHS